MLGKLLKYDLRSVGKVWWISMLTMIFTSFGGSIAFRTFREVSLSPDASKLFVIQLIAYLAFLLSIIIVGICFVSVSIMIYIRYFKHLFTDEGYLTFTLPVSRKQIFFSKMVNAFVWTVLSYAVFVFCILAFAIISTPTTGNGLLAIDTFIDFLHTVEVAFAQSGLWIVAQGTIFVLIAFASVVLSTAVVYFCITLGSTIVKRGKVLVSIVVYYLLNMVYGAVVQIVVWALMFAYYIEYYSVLVKLDFNVINGAAVLLLLVIFAIISTLAAIFYCLTLNILERKLNLA